MRERASGRGGDAKRSSESEKVEVPIPRAGFDAHERGGAPEGRGDCGWLNGVCMHGNWRTRGELANPRVGKAIGKTGRTPKIARLCRPLARRAIATGFTDEIFKDIDTPGHRRIRQTKLFIR